jgi:death-on-curing protein
MTREPGWIGKKALLLLHEESLAEFGGARGLRDEGLLDSALARPRNLHAYNDACTVAELAASYGFGIAKNHAFVDGNKRVAFMAIGLFLAINDQRLVAGQADAIATMLRVAGGETGEQALAGWIAANAAKVSRSSTPAESSPTRRRSLRSRLSAR